MIPLQTRYVQWDILWISFNRLFRVKEFGPESVFEVDCSYEKVHNMAENQYAEAQGVENRIPDGDSLLLRRR